ncbi:MAG: hypothetical protein H0W42_02955 [Gemmatimonadaceae bacterium]|nr:hypothetical protein [Gemmatimonadaceae bacterium]
MAAITTSLIVGSLITAGVSAGTSIYANRSQRKANEQASRDTVAMNTEQIGLETKRMEQDREMWLQEQSQLKEFHDAQQKQSAEDVAELRHRWDTDQANAEPYREVGYSAIGALAGRAGLPAPAPRQKPALPAHLSAPAPQMAPPASTDMTQPRDTKMWDAPQLPRTLGTPPPAPVSGTPAPAMTPAAYARIASSDEAMAAMSTQEREQFDAELATVPGINELMMPSRRRGVVRSR